MIAVLWVYLGIMYGVKRAKVYGVIHTKLNKLFYENVHTIVGYQ